jgi:hypothetical protein
LRRRQRVGVGVGALSGGVAALLLRFASRFGLPPLLQRFLGGGLPRRCRGRSALPLEVQGGGVVGRRAAKGFPQRRGHALRRGQRFPVGGDARAELGAAPLVLPLACAFS